MSYNVRRWHLEQAYIRKMAQSLMRGMIGAILIYSGPNRRKNDEN